MLTMRHHCRREVSDKQNALNKQKSNRKAKVKPCNTGISVPYHSLVCRNNKTAKHYHVPHKTKRLRSVKQRNEIRRRASNKFNQNHQHHEGERKVKSQCCDYQECQCSCSVHFSVREKPVAKPFTLRKPSIITDGRLTSIRGIFSHEVRSVNIERLVKETGKDQQGKKATVSNSPSSCVSSYLTAPAVASETNEKLISAFANKELKSKILEKTDSHLQTNFEDTVANTMQSGYANHSSTHTPKATGNTGRFASQPDEKLMQEAVFISSSENYPVYKFHSLSFNTSQGDHKKKNTHCQKQTNAVTGDMDVQDINSERLITPAGSEALNVDEPQFAPSPAIFSFSSATNDSEKSALKYKNQSSKEETVCRLAARLCRNLGSFPPQRHCCLLNDCRDVLLHHLQDRHGSLLQHSLRKIHSVGTHTAGKVWPSTVQNSVDNPHTSFSYTTEHEDKRPTGMMDFQTDNSPHKRYVREGFCKNEDRAGTSKTQMKQIWGMYSPQDLVTKLQRPCQDTLSQWSIRMPSPESLRAKQHSESQIFSQVFTKSQTPPWSYSCAGHSLDPFFPEPEKQSKVTCGENRRTSTALPLLEQWRNDPDLHFLFQDEDSRSHTSLGPPAELRNPSPDHTIKWISGRQLFGASANIPPKGFCYEPYYRFPHPSNSFNRSEESRMSLCTQPDVNNWAYSPFLPSTSADL